MAVREYLLRIILYSIYFGRMLLGHMCSTITYWCSFISRRRLSGQSATRLRRPCSTNAHPCRPTSTPEG
jgi:hypothetical protein